MFSWQGEYEFLLRKYGLEVSETGSTKEWKERVHEKTAGIGWNKRKKWCQMMKEEARLEEYTKSLVGKEEIRLQFRLKRIKKQCVGCVMMKGV